MHTHTGSGYRSCQQPPTRLARLLAIPKHSIACRQLRQRCVVAAGSWAWRGRSGHTICGTVCSTLRGTVCITDPRPGAVPSAAADDPTALVGTDVSRSPPLPPPARRVRLRRAAEPHLRRIRRYKRYKPCPRPCSHWRIRWWRGCQRDRIRR